MEDYDPFPDSDIKGIVLDQKPLFDSLARHDLVPRDDLQVFLDQFVHDSIPFKAIRGKERHQEAHFKMEKGRV